MNNKNKDVSEELLKTAFKKIKERESEKGEFCSPLDSLDLPYGWKLIVKFVGEEKNEKQIFDLFTEIWTEIRHPTNDASLDKQPSHDLICCQKAFRRKIVKIVNDRFSKAKAKPDSKAFKDAKLVADWLNIKLTPLESISWIEKTSMLLAERPKLTENEITALSKLVTTGTEILAGRTELLQKSALVESKEHTQEKTPADSPPLPVEPASEQGQPPLCNECGVAMMVKKNRTTGDEFWGCRNYNKDAEKCLGTLNLDGTIGRNRKPRPQPNKGQL